MRPEPPNGVVQTLLEIDKSVCRPDLLLQLLPGDNLAGVVQQHLQDLHWLFLKFDLESVLAEFTGAKVGLKRPESYGRPR